ncbi:RICIN domain-containing protein [Actinoplanes sp. NPDC024001]|uniref:RICIN domain-containing protein n=1 Tax=Actinoplanes sp. NPDC024001 TaxID=3154598 RepID=UPI0033DB4839
MNKAIRRFVTGAAVVAGFLAVTAVPAAAVEGGPTHVLRNLNSNDAVAVQGASKSNGALAIQYPFKNNGVDNDIMVLEYVDQNANDWVRLKPLHAFTPDGNVHNDKCLAVQNAATGKDKAIIQYTCTYGDTNNDVWREQIVKRANGTTYYQFRNVHSGMCMVVKGAVKTDGAQLITHDCDGGANTLWNHSWF